MNFIVPGPPVPKARARVVGGHAHTPSKTRAYEKHVAAVALAARSYERAWRLDRLYGVTIDVYRRGGRGDADNYAKAILDGCNGILWADDGQVRDLRVRIFDLLREHAGNGLPRVEVTTGWL